MGAEDGVEAPVGGPDGVEGVLVALRATGLREKDSWVFLGESGAWREACDYAARTAQGDLMGLSWRLHQVVVGMDKAAVESLLDWLEGAGIHPLSVALFRGWTEVREGDFSEEKRSGWLQILGSIGDEDHPTPKDTESMEANALWAYRLALGREFLVYYLSGYDSKGLQWERHADDQCGFRVRIEDTDTGSITHWNDGWLDPYWNVHILAGDPRLAGLDADGAWTDGPSIFTEND